MKVFNAYGMSTAASGWHPTESAHAEPQGLDIITRNDVMGRAMSTSSTSAFSAQVTMTVDAGKKTITMEASVVGINRRSDYIFYTGNRSLELRLMDANWTYCETNCPPVDGKSKVDGARQLDEKICKRIEASVRKSPDKMLDLVYELIILRRTCSDGAGVVTNEAAGKKEKTPVTDIVLRHMLSEKREDAIKSLNKMLRGRLNL